MKITVLVEDAAKFESYYAEAWIGEERLYRQLPIQDSDAGQWRYYTATHLKSVPPGTLVTIQLRDFDAEIVQAQTDRDNCFALLNEVGRS